MRTCSAASGICFCTKAQNSSTFMGVTGSEPWSMNCWRTAGLFSAVASAVLSFSKAGRGVPAGATRPYHESV